MFFPLIEIKTKVFIRILLGWSSLMHIYKCAIQDILVNVNTHNSELEHYLQVSELRDMDISLSKR